MIETEASAYVGTSNKERIGGTFDDRRYKQEAAAAIGRAYGNHPQSLRGLTFKDACQIDAYCRIWHGGDSPFVGMLHTWVNASPEAERLEAGETAWLMRQLERRGHHDQAGALYQSLQQYLAAVDPPSEDAGVLRDVVSTMVPHLNEAECRELLERLSVSFFDPGNLPEEVSLRDPSQMKRLEAWQEIFKSLKTQDSCEALYLHGLMPVIKNFRGYDIYWRNYYGDYAVLAGDVENDEAVSALREYLIRSDGSPDQHVANVLSHVYRKHGEEAYLRWINELNDAAYMAHEDGDLYAQWLMAASFAQALTASRNYVPFMSTYNLRQALDGAGSDNIRCEAVRRMALLNVAYHRFEEAHALVGEHQAIDTSEETQVFLQNVRELIAQAQKMVDDEKYLRQRR